jgi:hypothetical protein
MHTNLGHVKMLWNDRERLTRFRSGRDHSGRKRHTLRDFRLYGV